MKMLKAHIVTLSKPVKSPTTPAIFRQISLLNVHIKVYAKLLAEIDILSSLVKHDQMGFTKGR